MKSRERNGKGNGQGAGPGGQGWGHRAKVWLAEKIGGRWERQSLSARKRLLVIVILFLAGYAGGLILGLIHNELPEIGQLSSPKIVQPSRALSREQLAREVRDFRRFMDSLGQTNSGRAKRDSILKEYPFLMDSIAVLENRMGNN